MSKHPLLRKFIVVIGSYEDLIRTLKSKTSFNRKMVTTLILVCMGFVDAIVCNS
jgi:hypothetical protein